MRQRILVGLSMFATALIMGVLLLTLLVPQQMGSAEVFVRTTSVTTTNTAYLTTVSTSTFTTTIITTEVSSATVVAAQPKTVNFTGQATSTIPGSKATGVVFAGAKGSPLAVAVNGGLFQAELNNVDSYNIKIQYVNAVGITGSCTVGILLLNTVSDKMSASLTC